MVEDASQELVAEKDAEGREVVGMVYLVTACYTFLPCVEVPFEGVNMIDQELIDLSTCQQKKSKGGGLHSDIICSNDKYEGGIIFDVIG